MQQDVFERVRRLGSVGGVTLYKLGLSEAGRVQLRQAIAQKRAELAALEAELSHFDPPPALMRGPAALPPCPHCGKDDFRAAGPRGNHVRYCARHAAEPPAVLELPPRRRGRTPGAVREDVRTDRTARAEVRALYDEYPGAVFTCPRCRSQAHARAVNADHCQKCARELRVSPRSPAPAFGTGMQILDLNGNPKEQPA